MWACWGTRHGRNKQRRGRITLNMAGGLTPPAVRATAPTSLAGTGAIVFYVPDLVQYSSKPEQRKTDDMPDAQPDHPLSTKGVAERGLPLPHKAYHRFHLFSING